TTVLGAATRLGHPAPPAPSIVSVSRAVARRAPGDCASVLWRRSRRRERTRVRPRPALALRRRPAAPLRAARARRAAGARSGERAARLVAVGIRRVGPARTRPDAR